MKVKRSGLCHYLNLYLPKFTNMSSGTKIFALPISQVCDRVKNEIINMKVFWKCVIEVGPN